jgi:hypothetical protein
MIALIAVTVAAWTLLRPPPARSPAPASGQQIAAAKARACGAYTTVSTAVSLQTHAYLGSRPRRRAGGRGQRPLSDGRRRRRPASHLDPATPPDLAAAVRSFADGLQDIAMNALARLSSDDPAQAARLRDAEAASARVADLCK